MKKNRHISFGFAKSAALVLLLGCSHLLADDIGTASSTFPIPKTQKPFEGLASWYCVPANSLARRRARPGEFTAAHNRLPIGTVVRVTRLTNGCSVVVRITDRGITGRRANIDICREAAEELGMIRAGFSRVRMEIIAKPDGTTVIAQDSVDVGRGRDQPGSGGGRLAPAVSELAAQTSNSGPN